MSTRVSTRDVLLRAAEEIEARGWCTGTGTDGAGRICMVRAVRIAVDGEAATGVASREFETIMRALRAHVGKLLSDWNDDPGRTKVEVLAALRTVAEQVPA